MSKRQQAPPRLPEDMSFEQAMQRLEAIVKQLELGQIGLEEAIKVFEEGMTLYHGCLARLQDVEKRLERLVKTETGFQLELIEENAQG